MLTEDKVMSVMKERGYESMSHAPGPDGKPIAIMFIKNITDEITLHAKVELKSDSISLSFVELKYFCQLLADKFAFDHKDFEKYEQIITMYAAKCLDIDVFGILDSLKKTIPVETAPKIEIKERKRKLWDKVVKVGKEKGYNKELCLEFYNYWTESNEGGKRMRFEMEKIFDIEKRLVTWIRHDKKWSKTFVDKKVEKQDEEAKKSTTINKGDLF